MSAATYPVATIAKLLMLTGRRVQQLTKEGVLPKAERGRYELAPVVQAYIKHLRDETRHTSKHQEQSRISDARAKAIELRNAMLEGQLVDFDEQVDVMDQILGTIKYHLMSIPKQVARHDREIADKIDELLTIALNDASESFGKMAEEARQDSIRKAARAAKRKAT